VLQGAHGNGGALEDASGPCYGLRALTVAPVWASVVECCEVVVLACYVTFMVCRTGYRYL
jgi:hypothetical protein